jgi:hypothetical protein
MELNNMNLKFLLFATATALIVASVPAQAHPVDFVTTLSGTAEVPANASPGTGTATVTLNDDTFSMRVVVDFSGLLGNVTASHIHCCTTLPGTGNAGVATPVPTFPGFPLGATSGHYDQTFDLTQASSWNPAFITANGGSVATAFSAFATGMNNGSTYVNVHTSSFGGGEIRGFLVAVPEPSTYALMLSGVAAVLGLSRRQQRRV